MSETRLCGLQGTYAPVFPQPRRLFPRQSASLQAVKQAQCGPCCVGKSLRLARGDPPSTSSYVCLMRPSGINRPERRRREMFKKETYLPSAVYEPKYKQPTIATMTQLIKCARTGTLSRRSTTAKYEENGIPRSRAKLQHRRLCHVCDETRQNTPVAMTSASSTIAPAFVPKA